VQRLLHPKASPTPWTRAGQTDIRVVAATNRDLELPLARGEFREDLYYRLNVVEIRIPPLRDRKEEILIRAARFLAKFNQQYGWSRQLSPETTARLVEYSWGGNVRELENIIRRMVVLNDGEQAFANLVARRRPLAPSAARSSSLSTEGLREIARRGRGMPSGRPSRKCSSASSGTARKPPAS
jgi:two-component system, NtrC family, response regulator AtoC